MARKREKKTPLAAVRRLWEGKGLPIMDKHTERPSSRHHSSNCCDRGQVRNLRYTAFWAWPFLGLLFGLNPSCTSRTQREASLESSKKTWAMPSCLGRPDVCRELQTAPRLGRKTVALLLIRTS